MATKTAKRRSSPKEQSAPAAKARGRSKANKSRRKRRNENRKLLAEAKAMTERYGVAAPDANPEDAMQETLEQAVGWLRFASSQVVELTEQELFRDTMVGKVPNEWIRLETDMRREVASIAQRMISLDIEGRRAGAAEALAEAIAPVINGVLSDLRLTAAQKRAAAEAVEARLRSLETSGRQLSPAA